MAELLADKHEKENGDREPPSELIVRAHEIAAFLGIPVADAIERLSKGFGYQHQRVNDDFRRCNPVTDEELLNWYRTTEEYIWELSAYHLDPGFNYSGMCAGIAERLKNQGSKRVLCLGDGIGDLTLILRKAGFDAVYHDLAGSRTAEFAEFHNRSLPPEPYFLALESYTGKPDDLSPELCYCCASDPRDDYSSCDHMTFDAVVSLDFMEHVDPVSDWCRAVYDCLRPGGLFMSQNAFDCGSGPDGAIPCHLKINDKYAHATSETDGRALWDKLLIDDIGFVQESSNWYRRPV
jgi:SAM-dependent methyltransferase